MLISLSNVSNMIENGHFPIFSLSLVAIIVTIAMVKVKLIPNFYTWAIVLINQSEKQLLFFGLIGGQTSPLMHIALCFPCSLL